MKVLLITTVEAAKNACRKGLDKKYDQWLTYRPGIAIYCKEVLNINCVDLNSFISIKEQKDAYYSLLVPFTKLLVSLEHTYPCINFTI